MGGGEARVGGGGGGAGGEEGVVVEGEELHACVDWVGFSRYVGLGDGVAGRRLGCWEGRGVEPT